MIIRAIVNLAILIVEVALIAAIAALGVYDPRDFAILTFALALWLGTRLEVARLRNELNFYFSGAVPGGGLMTILVGASEALFKAVLAGLVALLTFSGTDPSRIWWVAAIFATCIFTGSNILRVLANRFAISPGRWGYFRIAAPLGLIFSVALAFLPIPTVAKIGELGFDYVFNTAKNPTIAQLSEVLFVLKQKLDELFYAVLRALLGDQIAPLAAVLTSVNMLTGFILGIYAVVVAEVVRWLEARS